MNIFCIKKLLYGTISRLYSDFNELIIAQAVLSVVFFLPAFLSPFLPTALSKYVLAIDIIFSYLYVQLQFWIAHFAELTL